MLVATFDDVLERQKGIFFYLIRRASRDMGELQDNSAHICISIYVSILSHHSSFLSLGK
jgi:hypothetical protein